MPKGTQSGIGSDFEAYHDEIWIWLGDTSSTIRTHPASKLNNALKYAAKKLGITDNYDANTLDWSTDPTDDQDKLMPLYAAKFIITGMNEYSFKASDGSGFVLKSSKKTKLAEIQTEINNILIKDSTVVVDNSDKHEFEINRRYVADVDNRDL
jgi:hypothetical protein